MTVCVVGLGYIGFPTALLLAREREVIGVDVDGDRVATIREGTMPFEESGLKDLYESVKDDFSVRTSIPKPGRATPSDGHPEVDTYVVATPTPLDEVTGVPDLQYVQSGIESIAEALTPGDMVILESTVPPGTTDRLVLPVLRQSVSDPKTFDYAYCPERALPGNTIHEMIHNDRVVGGIDEASNARAKRLYSFVEGEVYTANPLCAEFVKLIENTYRDVNIALANELGKLADQYGLDGRTAIDLANEHPRVDILSPGPGVGGHCLPIDPQFLTQLSDDARLISVSREINNTMPVHVLRLVREILGSCPDPRITVLGVAYKGDVDDTRETPARKFVRLSENEGYDVRVHDPHVESSDFHLESLRSAVDGSDCLVVVTDHSEYENLDPENLATSMRRPNVLDTRGILDPGKWEAAGFRIRRLADGA